MASSANETKALNDLFTSTLALLQQFATSPSPSSPGPQTAHVEKPPNPLRVLGDAAKLVKAHTTKLGLLAINKPFTPSAITKVLQSLLEELQSIATGTQQAGRRDTLSSTGVVWESCDAVLELGRLGLGGLALMKAEQYRDTIKDAIEELKEWAEGEDLDNEGQGDALLDDDDEGVDGDKDSIEDIFNAANSMPKDRPELKALAEQADGRLKKVAILYEALIKRRIKPFKIEENQDAARSVSRLDELMLHLKRMPHQIDELASNFYDLDEGTAKTTMQKVVEEGKAAASEMRNGWSGGEDPFTEWIIKWIDAVG